VRQSVQQYCVSLPTGVPVLQVRFVYVTLGASVPVQEKPKEPGVGHVTVSSLAQVLEATMSMQQKPVAPSVPAPGVPSLQRSVELSGVTDPVHEYPWPFAHVTAESVEHESVTVAFTEHPATARRTSNDAPCTDCLSVIATPPSLS
jgi:hypothetical protein